MITKWRSRDYAEALRVGPTASRPHSISPARDRAGHGTYMEMASRFLEPTLFALAALAVRGRIKR